MDQEEVQEIARKENQSLIHPEQQTSLISDQELLGMYSEIMVNVRKDRDEVQDAIDFFKNIVVNDGDSSTASKEAYVNLLKIKADQSDKMTKVADLMTRVKLNKLFPPYMNHKEKGTTVNIIESPNLDRRSIIQKIKSEEKNKK